VRFFLGLDLGQAYDYTALGILERIPQFRDVEITASDHGVPYRRTVKQGLPNRYECRHLQRFKIGTPYPAIVSSVQEMLGTPALRGQTELVVDSTGVGRPVVDMLRQQGLKPIAVTITGGDTVTLDAGDYRVPKRDLVGAVQVLLQTERLKIAKALPEAAILQEELLNFKVKITEDAHDTYGAWRTGTHDDLVLAVAVAAWYGERERPRRFRPASSHSIADRRFG
jgi:hypothetical protein